LIVANVLAIAVVAAGITLVSALLRPADTGETSLDRLGDYGEIPAFTLVERSGRRITHEDLRGSVWVANFIYARLVLVDRAGRIRAYHLATDDDSLARLRPNVKTLLGERRTG
jgi:hypothetical protein